MNFKNLLPPKNGSRKFAGIFRNWRNLRKLAEIGGICGIGTPSNRRGSEDYKTLRSDFLATCESELMREEWELVTKNHMSETFRIP